MNAVLFVPLFTLHAYIDCHVQNIAQVQSYTPAMII